jgi:UDP:flavonoid glycosyltransferase YjiC (YdhE family)
VPRNARLVDWVSYVRTMPRCDVVVCHGGHGTVARALACGCVVVVVPAAGDMNENAARVDWAGVGVRVPRRLCAPGPVRLAVLRALASPAMAARARELAAWARVNDGAARGAELVEEFAARSRDGA